MDNSPFSFSIDTTTHPYTVISLVYNPTTGKPMKVQVAPEQGSNMFSWFYGADTIIVYDEQILAKRGFTGNFVLFPTPNRVKDFTYLWQGRAIPLIKHGKKVDIHHQLVYDEPWQYDTPVVSADSVALSTHITIDPHSPLFEGFPFPCTLTLTYTLTVSGIRVTYSVENLGESDLPFGFGLHPYFNRLSGNDKTMVSIPADMVMEASEDRYPTGKLLPVSGTSFDLRTPRALSTLTLDDVYTKLTPGQSAFVDYQTQGFKVFLKASEDFTHTVIYTGDAQAVCIENQTCSTDAHNLYAAGFTQESHLLVVPPKATHQGWISYEIEQHR
jgi:aldose 1-epimerase